MVSAITAAAALSLLIWLYLLFLRGGYWRAEERLEGDVPGPASWPDVVAVVPAREEADVIGRAVAALLAQDYPGRLDVILVDDHSGDGTAEQAVRAAERAGRPEALSVVAARTLPPGWSGKVWAMAEGLRHADEAAPRAAYLWLSDADIEHAPDNLRRLVAKAEAERRDLVSLMAGLSCRAFWERLLIPPFVYFFQMLYPFAWVNDPAARTAAAAGGCILLRRAALARAGGFAAIGGELIDDCALARRIKDLTLSGRGAGAGGGIWIGLTGSARSIRPYRGLSDIWAMVARTAYTQLGHSPVLLAGALAGMVLTYLAPPLAALGLPLHGAPAAALLGLAAWLLMSVSARPTLRLYRQPIWLVAMLPAAAALYCAMTLDSALGHWRGRGGAWKGRVHPAARKLEQRPPGL
ncbi:MAG: glycosyltransferase [Kiloniellaceae bacterium]